MSGLKITLIVKGGTTKTINIAPKYTGCRRREKIDSHRDQERIQNTLNDTGTEKSQLERIRLELNTQIELLHKEIAKLQTANNEMQRQRDHLADIKNDVEQDKMRHIRENERWSVEEQ